MARFNLPVPGPLSEQTKGKPQTGAAAVLRRAAWWTHLPGLCPAEGTKS